MIFVRFLLAVVLATVILAYTSQPVQASWWDFQSIDTMKYSRDPSREYLDDPEAGKAVAEQTISNIAKTGATHVSIATPYDEEFLPVLKIWVDAARQHNLKIWFRGNFSGWEEWFEYEEIDREDHLRLTEEFLRNNLDLFQDGDVFSACPECENGGPGDPRMNGDVDGHREFLIDEYKLTSQIFREAGLNVRSNFHSMNGDVAMLIMNRDTTAALGGLVVVDHYVRDPEQLNEDINAFAERSGGKVILGEFGAPIPDIHGEYSNEEQKAWIQEALALLAENQNLIGINYWTSVGGSTAIWNENGTAKPAEAVVRKYFSLLHFEGRVVDEIGQPVADVQVVSKRDTRLTDSTGTFIIRSLDDRELFGFSKEGYKDQVLTYKTITADKIITFTPEHRSLWYRIQLWLSELFL